VESVEMHLSPTVWAPEVVRGWLRGNLRAWGLDGLSDVAELLATELVTNVVEHVGTPMSVRASRQQDLIRLEVDDPSPEPPVLESSGSSDDHGRGVFLVDALAGRWGAIRHPGDDGKTVWFELDLRCG
jgi:anti-sigma regulatory factor (Ser/Thr protein kinase)